MHIFETAEKKSYRIGYEHDVDAMRDWMHHLRKLAKKKPARAAALYQCVARGAMTAAIETKNHWPFYHFVHYVSNTQQPDDLFYLGRLLAKVLPHMPDITDFWFFKSTLHALPIVVNDVFYELCMNKEAPLKVYQALIDAGADVNMARHNDYDNIEIPVLAAACLARAPDKDPVLDRKDLIRLLMQHGADKKAAYDTLHRLDEIQRAESDYFDYMEFGPSIYDRGRTILIETHAAEKGMIFSDAAMDIQGNKPAVPAKRTIRLKF